MKILIYTILFFTPFVLYCQSMILFDIDSTDFPVMRAKIFVLDNNGKQITNLPKTEFEIAENGLQRYVHSFSCPAPPPSDAISSVLTIDVSGSMLGSNLKIAREAAEAWINALPDYGSECAITAFNSLNYLISDFSSNKTDLKLKLNKLYASGGTDFNAGFINPMAGSLLIADKGKNQKVVVFLTDGYSSGNEQAIIKKANEIAAKIYCVTIGFDCPEILKNISEQTGGQWFDNVTTVEEATEIYYRILLTAQGAQPCEIEWESAYSCSSELVNLHISIPVLSVSNFYHYTLSAEKMASLEFDPKEINFKFISSGIRQDSIITVTAMGTDFTVSDIKCSNPAYSISPQSFELSKDESKELTLSYLPADSSYEIGDFDIENNICNQKYYTSGGLKHVRPAKSTLRLISPNGGEKFLIGGETVISWDGVLPSDTVTLEYSTNKGISWKIITNCATNLHYDWKNIPSPPSDNCLIRATLISNAKVPSIEWQKCLGGSGKDIAKDIQTTKDKGCIIAGYSDSKDGDVFGFHGDSDFWIIKLDEFGNNEWRRAFGGSKDDFAYSVQQTKDQGYIVSGTSISDDADQLEFGGGDSPYRALKLNKTGASVWNYQFYGEIITDIRIIQETKDRGFLAFLPEDKKGRFYRIVRLDKFGNYEWINFVMSRISTIPKIMKLTSDEGFVVAGFSKNSYRSDSCNFSVIKYNNEYDIEWNNEFGGQGDDRPYYIYCTRDRGFIVAGYSNSDDGDITGCHGNYDFWIVKLDSGGKISWQKSLGGSGDDRAFYVQLTFDDGCIVAGYSDSEDGDRTEYYGGKDFWIVKLNDMGKIEWEKSLGGSGDEIAYSVCQIDDDEYIVAGESSSNNGNVSGNHGQSDYWVVKLKYYPLCDTSDAVFSIVKPRVTAREIDMEDVIVNNLKDSVITSYLKNSDPWPCRIDSIYFEGREAYQFSLVSKKFPSIIDKDNSVDVEFRFRPESEGFKKAEIVILSQSEKLKYPISGTGFEPRIEFSNNFIDFGIVEVGQFRDSLDAAIIKNISNKPILVYGTKRGKPYNLDFSTISEIDNQILEPGETLKLDLRFSPTEKGRTSGTIIIDYDGVGSPAVFQFFGEGVISKPHIEISVRNLPDIICDNKSTAEFPVLNNGGQTLIVSEINLKGPNVIDFNINTTMPINVNPGEAENIIIDFVPKSTGRKNVYLELVSNAVNDTLISEDFSARKDSLHIYPENSIIDLCDLNTNERKDTLLKIVNNGTIDCPVNAEFSSNLSSIDTAFSIKSLDEFEIMFSFKGMATKGKMDETITIIDSICGFSREVKVIGNIIIHYPLLKASIDSIPELICDDSSSGFLKVINLGGEKLIISEINISGKDADDFFIVEKTPILIEPDSTKNIEIKFRPKESGLKEAIIEIYSNSSQNPLYKKNISAFKEKVALDLNNKEINFPSLDIGKSDRKTISLTNTGDTEIVVGSISLKGLSGNVFTLEGNEPGAIAPGAGLDFDIVFSPDQAQEYTDSVFIYVSSPCERKYFAEISGTGKAVNNEIIVSIPDLKGKPGTDNFEIPVYARTKNENIVITDISYECTISYDASMFLPLTISGADELSNSIEGSDRIIRFNGSQGKLSNENTVLAKISGKLLLFNTINNTVNIDAVNFTPTATVTRQPGSLTIEEYCAPDLRGVVFSAPPLTISPNPANAQATISINSTNINNTILGIYDLLGNCIKNIDIETNGDYILKLTDFPSGIYMLLLKTGTDIYSERLIVE